MPQLHSWSLLSGRSTRRPPLPLPISSICSRYIGESTTFRSASSNPSTQRCPLLFTTSTPPSASLLSSSSPSPYTVLHAVLFQPRACSAYYGSSYANFGLCLLMIARNCSKTPTTTSKQVFFHLPWVWLLLERPPPSMSLEGSRRLTTCWWRSGIRFIWERLLHPDRRRVDEVTDAAVLEMPPFEKEWFLGISWSSTKQPKHSGRSNAVTSQP